MFPTTPIIAVEPILESDHFLAALAEKVAASHVGHESRFQVFLVLEEIPKLALYPISEPLSTVVRTT